MKKIFSASRQNIFVFCLLQLAMLGTHAQDSTATAGTLGAETSSYGPTWVWMTGAVVSILLIISLIRWNTNKRTSKN